VPAAALPLATFSMRHALTNSHISACVYFCAAARAGAAGNQPLNLNPRWQRMAGWRATGRKGNSLRVRAGGDTARCSTRLIQPITNAPMVGIAPRANGHDIAAAYIILAREHAYYNAWRAIPTLRPPPFSMTGSPQAGEQADGTQAITGA